MLQFIFRRLLVVIPTFLGVTVLAFALIHMIPGDPVLNANSGVAAWARVVNGNGETAFDCDVSDTTGTGEIKIQNTVLFEGGETRMVSGTLGG